MSTLKILREVGGHSQEEMADFLSINQSTYSKLERNPRDLRGDQLEKLAEFFKVGITDILATEGVTFNFSGNIEKNNGYINNNYVAEEATEKIIAAKDGEIKSLKEEIEYLRAQNKQLLDLLGKK